MRALSDDIISKARSARLEDIIARHGVRLRRQGVEQVGPCPQCGGEDRFSISVKKQVFNCRGCGAKGDAIALERFLSGSTFEAAVLTLAGTDADPATKPKPKKPLRKIPYEYRDPQSGETRYRKLRSEYGDGSKSFFFEPLNRNGSEPLLYGGDRIADLPEGQPLFLVEGEKCVERLREFGQVAVSGDSGYKSKWLPSHAELLRGLDIIFWPDSDKQGESYIANAAQCLNGHAASLRVVRPFGLPNGAKGRDVCDWEGDAAALAKLAASSEPYATARETIEADASQRFKLAPFSDIKLDATAPYLVKGLIPRCGLTIIWGPPKCGKSFFSFDLVMHVALGWDYRGRRVKQGAVVYCALEGAEGFRARVEAFRQKKMAERPADAPFYLVASPMALTADHHALIAAIRATLGQSAPAAVVIDTLNRSIAGSESDDRDMAAYIVAADAIRDTFGCAVIIVHHCGIDATRPRGHTSLTGAADAQIAVKRDAADNIAVAVEYMKDGPASEEILSRLEPIEVGTDADGDPITSCVVVPVESSAHSTKKASSVKLTKGAAIALKALLEAIDECGVIPPASNHTPVGVKAVTVKQWREYAYRQGICGSDDDRARRAVFQRAHETLVAAGRVAIWDPYAWIP